METYIAILRGINVSGKKLIKMEALKELLNNLKFKNVATYIQSGNIIFQFKKTFPQLLENKISSEIQSQFNIEVPVFVIEKSEFQSMLSANPFAKNKLKDPLYIHVTFLSSVPAQEYADKIKDLKIADDEFELKGRVVYLYCPGGYGNTKLNNNFFEKKLKVSATTRNLNTANQLALLSADMD